MILKSMSRKSNSTQLIKYVLRYQVAEKHTSKTKEEATVILRHNLRSRSIEGMIKEYQRNESFRVCPRKNAVVLYHDVVSFAPGDAGLVTNDVLKDIAARYVYLRCKDSLCLVVAHKGKTKHTHLHAVVSGIKLNGYSSRVSKGQFKNIVDELERYQREKHQGLTHSKNEHRANVIKTHDQLVDHVKRKRQTAKEKLIRLLDDTYHKSGSSKDFLNRLSSDYQLYYRDNRLQGLFFEGKKYRIAKLGFDNQKLESLDHKLSPKDKLFLELQSIRTSNVKERNRKILKSASDTEPIQSIIQLRQMNQIAAVRESRAGRQIADTTFERTLEIDNESTNDCSINDAGERIVNLMKPKLIDYDFAR